MLTSGVGLTAERAASLKAAGLEHVQLSFQDSILAKMRWDIFRRGCFPWFVLGDQPVTIAPRPTCRRFVARGSRRPASRSTPRSRPRHC